MYFAAGFYATYDANIMRRVSFVLTKETKNSLRSALRIPALVRFYLWDTGELTFFTLFAVCAFKGTRAVRSDTSLRHYLLLYLTYFCSVDIFY